MRFECAEGPILAQQEGRVSGTTREGTLVQLSHSIKKSPRHKEKKLRTDCFCVGAIAASM